MSDHPAATPRWVRAVTIAGVSVVAAVSAVVSYHHMQTLADDAGEGWRSHIIPLSADGLLVAASMVMFVKRRTGERAGPLPWTGLVLGLAASLGANLAVADWASPVSIAVSGWPPLALAVAFELLIMVCRTDEADRADERAEDADRTGTGTPDRTAGPAQGNSERPEVAVGGPDRTGADRTTPDRQTGPASDQRKKADRSDAELLAELEALADRLGRRPGRNTVAAELGIGGPRAGRLLEEFDRTGPRRAA